MDQGSLAFAGLVTIIGMGVVFSFLTILSLGMWWLKVSQQRALLTEQSLESSDRLDVHWLTAAVAAYTAQQGQFDEVSAVPWDPSRRYQ